MWGKFFHDKFRRKNHYAHCTCHNYSNVIKDDTIAHIDFMYNVYCIQHGIHILLSEIAKISLRVDYVGQLIKR